MVSIVEVDYEQEFTDLEVRYMSIDERLSRRLGEQHWRASKQSLVKSEDWKSIKIREFLGSRLCFGNLISVAVPVSLG